VENIISILGSTGSIGTQSLEVIKSLGRRVIALTGNRNTSLMERQAREFMPAVVAMYDEKAAEDLRARLRDTGIRVVSGMEGLIEAAAIKETGTVITAVVGMIGLRPTMAAIREGKRIALANKETLVCAGSLVMDAAEKYGAEILPVDSEHSAIFQCLTGSPREVKRLILTASGGPFRGKSAEELGHVTKSDALRHPNWSMGAKITIDSATMMNKGLELIEAMHLFNVEPEQIRILVHPQSIVHSAVEYVDNSIIAQMGAPDMKIPIQLALTWPNREMSTAPELDFTKLGGLTFEEPDLKVFRCLELAIRVAKEGGLLKTVMNAANEQAVSLFLQDKISFNGIYECVAGAVSGYKNNPNPGIDEILETDREVRQFLIEN